MKSSPAVVTGLGIICAAGRDVDEFWQCLLSGRSAVTPIADPAYAAFPSPHAGQVPDEWLTAVEGMDRSTGLALIAARQALAQARLDVTGHDPARFGIVLGKCQATPAGTAGDYEVMHSTADNLAALLSSTGPRIAISTACAAGGNAVGLARDKILTGEADVMLAGGVDPLMLPTFAGFAGLQALATHPSAPYSRSDGLNLGEGAAFLIVERLDAALARGATPLAEVAGYGLSADAYHATAPDPTGRGGTSAVRRACADAGIEPAEVDYVSGHGTGTKANDRMERKVMRSVFGERAGSVPMSGIKSFTGHTLGAAGALEAVASVLALATGTAPPTANFDAAAAPADEFDFVPNEPRTMPIDVVVSTNYAFGGNNVAVVFRSCEPDGPTRRPATLADRAVVVSGIGPVTALGVGVADWSAALRDGRDAFTPITAFDPARYRCRHAAQAPALDGRTYAPASVWRHMNRLSRMSIAATRLAWEDAAITLRRAEMDQVGLMFATESGSLESSIGYDRSVRADPGKPALLSFSNLVLNATGGAVCQALGFRGPTTTICHGNASASIAVDCAVETIRAGKAEVVVVLAADEFDEFTFAMHDARGELSPTGRVRPYDRQRDGTVLGAGALALVLESREHCERRGGRAYAQVLASAHVGAATGADVDDHAARGLAGIVQRCDGPIALAVGSGDGRSVDGAEAAALAKLLPDTMVTAPVALTGDCRAASGGMAVAVAALSVHSGLVPPVAGLTDPEHGALDRYASAGGAGHRVATALALTSTLGSVRGAVLLGEPR